MAPSEPRHRETVANDRDRATPCRKAGSAGEPGGRHSAGKRGGRAAAGKREAPHCRKAAPGRLENGSGPGSPAAAWVTGGRQPRPVGRADPGDHPTATAAQGAPGAGPWTLLCPRPGHRGPGSPPRPPAPSHGGLGLLRRPGRGSCWAGAKRDRLKPRETGGESGKVCRLLQNTLRGDRAPPRPSETLPAPSCSPAGRPCPGGEQGERLVPPVKRDLGSRHICATGAGRCVGLGLPSPRGGGRVGRPSGAPPGADPHRCGAEAPKTSGFF